MKALIKTVVCLTLALPACDGQMDDRAAPGAAASNATTSSADDRDGFIGTWLAMSSDMTTDCADNVAEANATITSLTWNKGARGELVAVGGGGSCPLETQVTGSTASVAAGQGCATSDGAYGFSIVTRDGFIFVLGADGRTASLESSGRVVYDEGGTVVMACSYDESATYEKTGR